MRPARPAETSAKSCPHTLADLTRDGYRFGVSPGDECPLCRLHVRARAAREEWPGSSEAHDAVCGCDDVACPAFTPDGEPLEPFGF